MGLGLIFTFCFGKGGTLIEPVPPTREAATIETLKKKIVAVGKLPFKREVPVRYVDKAQLTHSIALSWTAGYPEALSEKEARLIRLMGFVKNGADIKVRDIRKRILLDNAGGFYNEKTHQLYVLSNYREVDYINSMILIHELRHALQDQYFDLTSLLHAHTDSDFDDRKLAVVAALEGDATFLMVRCGNLDANILTATPSADALMSFLPVAKPSLLYGEPEVLKYQLLMPYIEGLRFVDAVFRKKKWNGVNGILHHPPSSTEQILHPGKYFSGEEPIKVMIQYRPEGYNLYHSGVLGEYYLGVLLKSPGDYSEKAYAQGWGGDTFHIFQKADSYVLVWESVWDKDIFCSHFYSDFTRFIEGQFKVNFKTGQVKGITFIAGKVSDREDYFFLAKSTNKIFFARSDNRDQMNALIYGGNYD